MTLADLTQVLTSRQRQQGDACAYAMVGKRNFQPFITYAALDRQARTIAGWLQRKGEPGDRVALFYPPNFEFIAAFFGCLYAGMVAVPLYPPRRNGKGAATEKALSNCGARIGLTSHEFAPVVVPFFRLKEAFSGFSIHATTGLSSRYADIFRASAIDSRMTAFIQYTSGSTGDPKGVMVTHGNLMANEEAISQAFETRADDICLNWLPLYHDMGLIGTVLNPLYKGYVSILMPPLQFLRNPLSWLEAISKHRATVCGAPDFAYELMARKATGKGCPHLDLGSWRVAFNGAEPVRAATCRRFGDTFRIHGFRPERMYPCYGLAEATLFVAGGRAGVKSRLWCSPDEPDPAEPRGLRKEMVSCGFPRDRHHILIVNPKKRTVCPDGRIGEIWVRGPSVALGYWQRQAETERVFHAKLADGTHGSYMRTGDLGLIHEGELYVAGRLKDLMIIRGRNHYPPDLEASAESSDAACRGCPGAAFTLEEAGEEKLVLVQEVSRSSLRHLNEARVTAAIRNAVGRDHELSIYTLVLVKPGALPKTGSGKIRRFACRELFINGNLGEIARDTLPVHEEPATHARRDGEAIARDNQPRTGLASYLAHLAGEVLKVRTSSISSHQSLTALGLDSLSAVTLQHRLVEDLGVEPSLMDFFQTESIAVLAAKLATLMRQSPAKVYSSFDPVGKNRFPLSPTQRGIWFLNKLAPKAGAYHNCVAFRIDKALDLSKLEGAFRMLMARHPALRTTFAERNGEPIQCVHSVLGLDVHYIDASVLENKCLAHFCSKLTRDPLNLESGPLFRVTVVRQGVERVLLLTVHHLISDFWSLEIMMAELEGFYGGKSLADLPPLSSSFSDHVQEQNKWLAGPGGETFRRFWQQRLAGELASLNLPLDASRPSESSYRGGMHRFLIESGVVNRLKLLGKEAGATFYTTLLTVFQTLLYRYSGQENFLIGSPTSGRRAAFKNVIGDFVNPVLLRMETSGEPNFQMLLTRTQKLVWEALSHRDFPFQLVVEHLQPIRDPQRPPLCQAMFSMQQPHRFGEAGSFFLGREGAVVPWNGLALESYPLERGVALFELTLFCVEAGNGLICSFEYRSDLFRRNTIEQMAARFQKLIRSVTAHPEQPISHLSLMTRGERRLLLDLAGKRTHYPHQTCIHHLYGEQVQRTPDAVALEQISDGDSPGQLSYSALNRLADRLAGKLRGLGLGREEVVGLCATRSLEMTVGILAILKAGGVYLPLDPDLPRDRMAWLLRDSNMAMLLTQDAFLEGLPAHELNFLPVLVLEETVGHGPIVSEEFWQGSAQNLAYVMYTSGSTGKPKGVQVTHRAVARLIFAENVAGWGAGRRFLHLAPPSFDAATFEVWGALLHGGRCVLCPGRIPTVQSLGRMLAKYDIDVLWLTTSLFNLVVDENPAILSRLKELLAGGEALSVRHVQRARRMLPGLRLINGYGPTENTTFTCCFEVPRYLPSRLPSIPIGRPVSNTRALVLDHGFEPVPMGMPGQLFIGGPGLARGYLARPGMTAGRWFPDPTVNEPGRRLYASGDRVRLLCDGTLAFLGRLDHQIKLRGFRIEPGEIEAGLRGHGAVAAAVVMLREFAPGEKQLVAYMIPRRHDGSDRPLDAQGQRGGHDALVEELRTFLSDRLPEYMVPSAWVFLKEWPLNANGKLDRASLPQPRPGEETYVPAETRDERWLASIWRQVLGREKVGIHDHFFELGGHSLNATRVVSRIRERFGVEIPLQWLFEHPTIAQLLPRLQAAKQDTGLKVLPPIRPFPKPPALPLSFAQQRLWFLDQLEGPNVIYNDCFVRGLAGPLHLSALECALKAIFQRHEALRTRFPVFKGKPVQVIDDPPARVLKVVDLTAMGGELASRIKERESHLPFHLSQGPLIRLTLLRLASREHLLLLSTHHIITDGWSLGVLVRELMVLYRFFAQPRATGNRVFPLDELDVGYTDFTLWQRSALKGSFFDEQVSYWRSQLTGMPKGLTLPCDHPRPALQTFRGRFWDFVLPRALTSQLQRNVRALGATLSMGLQAGFAVLLSRYSGQECVALGSPIANRHHRELEPLMGFFVNTLVMRFDLAGNLRVADYLDRVRQVAQDAYAHQDVPFENVVEILEPERNRSHSPLFQAMVVLQNAPLDTLWFPGLNVIASEHVHTGTAKFDLFLSLTETEAGLGGRLEYNSDLFLPVTIQRMVLHYESLLEAMVARPEARLSDLNFLNPGEKALLLREWNDYSRPLSWPGGLQGFLEIRAQMSPAALAVVVDRVKGNPFHFTYEALDRHATHCAAELRQLGVGPDIPVGLFAERSMALAVGLMGIFKAGGVYVPMDPTYPGQRLNHMIRQAGVRVILTEPKQQTRLPPTPLPVLALEPSNLGKRRHPIPVSPVRVSPANLAYIMFTSGSTGQPKGVMNHHQAIGNRLAWMQQAYRLGFDDRVLQKTPITFDVSVWELLWSLGVGAALVFARPGGHRDPLYIRDLLVDQWITVLHFVPSMLEVFLEKIAGSDLQHVRRVICSGEALGRPLANKFFSKMDAALNNLYGPTEAAIDVTHWDCQPTGEQTAIPIGRPIANLHIHILDARLQPVPIGVGGELYIGGMGLARGYIRQPARTATTFLPKLLGERPGARWYRSGDSARLSGEGKILFLGRLDRQIKMRGFRVELGEIETALCRDPWVHEAAVNCRNDSGDQRLVAYIKVNEDLDPLPRNDASPLDQMATTQTAEQLNQWEEVWNETYKNLSRSSGSALNSVGWNDSYTGLPFSSEAMEEWVAATVTRIRGLKPKRILEIGCGTGMLLLRIAPECGYYAGTDLSPSAIGYVRRQLADHGLDEERVRLFAAQADRLDGLPLEKVDLVVLNSVVQYFPSGDYLLTVLEKATDWLVPGGRLFIGDVRSLPLLQAFHASVALAKASARLPLDDLRHQLEERVRNETELVLDPRFFFRLKQRLPRVRRVRVLLKKGTHATEMNRFRYDVCLHLDRESQPIREPVRLDWQRQKIDLQTIRVALSQQDSRVLVIENIPNPRVRQDVAIVKKMADSEATDTVADLRERLSQTVGNATMDPEELNRLGAERAFRVETVWSDSPDAYVAVFYPETLAELPEIRPFTGVSAGSIADLTNYPLRARWIRNGIKHLKISLARQLPEYMVPTHFVLLSSLPLSPNGKIDYKALPRPGGMTGRGPLVPPRNPTEERLVALWREFLDQDRIGIKDNFFELGGHSLLAAQLMFAIQRRFSTNLGLSHFFEAPTIEGLALRIKQETTGRQGAAPAMETLVPDPENRFQPFPLTDIQQAYWLGRSSGFELGDVATFTYTEFQSRHLDAKRLEGALRALIQRHDMLRAVIAGAEEQRVLASVPAYRIPFLNLGTLESETRESLLKTIRNQMSHRIFPADQWPLFEVRATHLGGGWTRLHISFDALIADAWSLMLLGKELIGLYKNPTTVLPGLNISFRDYVLGERALEDTALFRRSRDYWLERLDSLPPAPELPLAQNPSGLPFTRFTRHSFRLKPNSWKRLQNRAKREGLTPTTVLLTAFSEVLAHWCKSPRFTLNLTLFNRLPLHPQINDLVGDFTSLLLLEIKAGGPHDFLEKAQKLQSQLWRDVDHRYFSGIGVLRELTARQEGKMALFPVVFTSTLGVRQPKQHGRHRPGNFGGRGVATATEALGEVVYAITQTPQVWLDHQVLEEDGALIFNWDAVQGIFPKGLLGAMFGVYCRFLEALAEHDEAWRRRHWTLTPSDQLASRCDLNRTDAPIPQALLQQKFLEHARKRADTMALVSAEGWCSYRALATRARALAEMLRRKGARPNTLVAVVMEKGWEQAAAVLGILMAGAAYLPVDPDQPWERRRGLFQDGQVRLAVTQAQLETRLKWPEGLKRIRIPAGDRIPISYVCPAGTSDLAYVIFTSGSTGKPKGVAIEHRAAINTVLDVNARFNVTPRDRVLALSALNFDLSVYDIFGLFAAGGTLVQPHPGRRKEPQHWQSLMANHRISIWNSVPALMQILVDFIGQTQPESNSALRLVLMSGDWIPVSLPDRIRARWPEAEVIGLGGATEASIWSILYPICRVDASWRSIPYGKPMQNQRFHVLNQDLEPCPVWVPGDLYIGGRGLARCYWGDPQKTEARFLNHPRSGERLYKTGDLGRYLPDGNIEFLGRADFQVKVHGYRIELGEIEAALTRLPTIREAVVCAEGEHLERRLIAFLTPASEPRPSTKDLRVALQQKLPDYMVPEDFIFIETLPLTANGKVNREALTSTVPAASEPASEEVLPLGDLEPKLAKLVAQVLRKPSVDLRQNFFDLGGNSVHMVRLQNLIRTELAYNLSLMDLYQHPTIHALAKHLGGNAPGSDDQEPAPSESGGQTPTADEPRDIAVIGMSGRFPGAANLDSFWQNLARGVEAITFFSKEDLLAEGVHPSLVNHPQYVRANTVLEGVDLFDAYFFDMSPGEAAYTDPQQRLFLEHAWEAMEHAGYDTDRFPGSIGVYAGSDFTCYLFANLYPYLDPSQPALTLQTVFGNGPDYLATRVSYKMNLSGPSLSVLTACSTSLVAICLASQGLLDRHCDMALAGGVRVGVPLKEGYLYEEGSVFSRDGHCRAFDARAGGTITGNGVGAVVLKRLADAKADGDHIHGVIKGFALNNDAAQKVGYTAPSVKGQAEVIAKAQAMAGVGAGTVTMLEAHGTGTPMGDPIEVEALSQAFRLSTDQKQFCALGSVKTNIGHASAAAGIASFLKSILALKHRQIPPSLNFQKPNPRIDFAASPFFVNSQLRDWKPQDEQGRPMLRRVGVSSFGIGGTNAHLVLEEAPQPKPSTPAKKSELLVLSAKSESALDAASSHLKAFLEEHPETNLGDLAYTLQLGRKRFEYRRALICRTSLDAARGLTARDPKFGRTVWENAQRRPIFFMFSGHGTHHVGMARELYEEEPVFRRTVDHCAVLLEPRLGLDLRGVLYPEAKQMPWARRHMDRMRVSQPLLFTLEYALARLLIHWGLEPEAMIGHSSGEYVAACVAGVFSLEDALTLIAERGALMQKVSGGAMLSLHLPHDRAANYLDGELSLAAVNTPSLCVLSGRAAAIEALKPRLVGDKVDFRSLRISLAAHSVMIDPILNAFEKHVGSCSASTPKIPFLSNVTGTWITPQQATDPHYWARHLRATVQFADGMATLLAKEKGLFVEIGPGRALATFARQHPANKSDHGIFTTLPHPEDGLGDREHLLQTLGNLWAAGADINWRSFHDGERRHRLPLPTYPFERERFWIEPPASPGEGRIPHPGQGLDHKKADMADWVYTPLWKPTFTRTANASEPLNTRLLVFTDVHGLGDRLLDRLQTLQAACTVVGIGERFAKTAPDHYRLNPARYDDYLHLLQELKESDQLPDKIFHLWSVSSSAPKLTQKRLDHTLERAFYSLIHLAKSLGNTLSHNVDIFVVSNHLQDVTGRERVCPAQATLLGPVKVIPLEYHHLSCRSIDVNWPPPPTEPESLLPRLLVEELRLVDAEPMVAYRGVCRWVPFFEPFRLEAAPEPGPRIKQGGVYLITGGLGAIGLTIAHAWAAEYQPKLILTSRSGLPSRSKWDRWLADHSPQNATSRKIRRIQEIEGAGAEVRIWAADAANPVEMKEVIQQTLGRFGRIDGVIHAAGVSWGGAMAHFNAETVDEIMKAKVHGGWVLQTLLEKVPLDFMLFWSSITAVVGGVEESAYCAANSFLDMFARYHRHPGHGMTLSVNWDGWQGVGMADMAIKRIMGAVASSDAEPAPGNGKTIFREDGNRSERDHGEMLKKRLLLPSEGLELLARILQADRLPPQIIVSPFDITARVKRVQSSSTASFWQQKRPGQAHPRPRLRSTFEAPRNEVERQIAELWQEMMGLERVGIHDNFFELGGDSLMGARINTRLREIFKVQLPVKTLFLDPTVAGLAGHLRIKPELQTEEDDLVGQFHEEGRI